MRKGFGGNYRRASDSFSFSNSKTAPLAESEAKLLRESLKLSSCSSKNERKTDQAPDDKLATATIDQNQGQSSNGKLFDCLQDRTLVFYSEKKGEEDTKLMPQTNVSVGARHQVERLDILSSNRKSLPITEDESVSASVTECIKNFERTISKPFAAAENKPKVISKTRVAELRDTILRRSSENLADVNCVEATGSNKRPVSAIVDCSLGNFPKIPLSIVQRRSIGTLLKHPVSESVQLLSLTDRVSASKTSTRPVDVPIKSTRRQSAEYSSSLHTDKRPSVLRRSNIESLNKGVSCPYHTANTTTDTAIGSLIKTDSSDSGIDTRTDFSVNKCSPEGPDCVQQDGLKLLFANSSSFPIYSSSSTEQLSPEIRDTLQKLKYAHAVDLNRSSASSISLDLQLDEFSQMSQDELRYDDLVAGILDRLQQKKSELHQVHQVLLPSISYKTSFFYLVDLIKGVRIPESWVHPCIMNESRVSHASERDLPTDLLDALNCTKNKLEFKRNIKEQIEHKLTEQKDFESQFSNTVKCRVDKKKYDKYCLYLTELDKVLHLILMLANRLANTENTLGCLRSEEDLVLAKMLSTKRSTLLEKLDDAKLLKDGIDRRSEFVDSFLRISLSDSEFSSYQRLVSTVVRLHFVRQRTDECLVLYERQMKILSTIYSNFTSS